MGCTRSVPAATSRRITCSWRGAGAQGRLTEARALVAEAIDLSKQTSTGFLGPALFAAMAGVAEGTAERRRWLEEGHAMLGADCVAPSRLMFYRDAIEASLEDGNWDDALRYADALEQSVASEPVAFAQLVAARGRAMVAFHRDGPRPDIVAELISVRARLLRASFGGFVTGIDAALAHHPPASPEAGVGVVHR